MTFPEYDRCGQGLNKLAACNLRKRQQSYKPMSKRLSGFLRVPNKLLSCRGLSGNQKLVMAYVFGWKRCTVTRDVMAHHLGMKERTLDDVIHSLYELQILGYELPKSGATHRRVLFVRENDAVAELAWAKLYAEC